MPANPTTIDLDTELSAVNSILGSIGQSPVSSLAFENPEISFIYNLLKECNVDIQSEGWSFNKESHYKFTPDSSKHITMPTNILQLDKYGDHADRTSDVVIRDGKLYDRVEHTFEFTDDQYLDVVWLFSFADVPQVFKRYIICCASGRAATQLIANPQLVQLLASKEGYARAACMEYECNQGDPSFFGTPHETHYTSYQPFDALRR